ncbi:hypothetical protein F2Q70_00013656 [Brassica cretica]|uniref:Uncharacterized protein n=1 Tax=Brassica cretica TaxID=69181 RepID=A0A8S9M9B1_BRACR|nr:hypothetical protein F2Q70_00013656 [Brassica cretica]
MKISEAKKIRNLSSNVIKIGSGVFQDDLSYVEIKEHGIGALGIRQRKSKRRLEVMTVLDKSVWPQTRSNVMALSNPFKGTLGLWDKGEASRGQEKLER